MTVKAGDLRHVVALYAFAQTQDPDTGIITEGYSVWAPEVRASVEPLSTREYIASQATQAQATTRIVIRYREGVEATMRVLHRGIFYDLAGPPLPDKDSGLEYLTLLCKQVVA